MRRTLLALGSTSVAVVAAVGGGVGTANAQAGHGRTTSTVTASAATGALSAVRPAQSGGDWCDNRVEITGNGVRIRSAPSTSATVVGLGYKGDIYEYLGQVTGWYEIYGGHWVSTQYSYAYSWCD